MRTLSGALTAVLLAPGAVMVGAPASAAEETCQGLPATIVSHEERVNGTSGDDVVVAHGARLVLTGLGNDVVCTVDTVPVATSADGYRSLSVDGGDGTDTVDRSGDLDPSAAASIFDTEVFIGGPAQDYVVLTQTARVAVETGAGDDVVEMSAYDPRPGTVDLGPGDDLVASTYDNTLLPPCWTGICTVARGAAPPLRLQGGRGDDHLRVEASARRGVLDLRDGTWTSGAADRLTFRGFDSFTVSDDYDYGPVDVRGTADPDDVSIGGFAMGTVRLGGGADSMTVHSAPRGGAVLRGGRGEDLLETSDSYPGDTLVIDLASGRYGAADRSWALISEVEDVFAYAFERPLRLVGDGHANELSWLACRGGGVARGGAGDDTVRYLKTYQGNATSCRTKDRPRLRAFGEAGNDLLVGGPHADVLVGDEGYDQARGGPGTDSCPGVERRRSC